MGVRGRTKQNVVEREQGSLEQHLLGRGPFWIFGAGCPGPLLLIGRRG